MRQLEKLDLSVLPEVAQTELYDFYLLLKQRYNNESQQEPVGTKVDEGLEELLESNKRRNIHVDPSIDLSALAGEVNDVKI